MDGDEEDEEEDGWTPGTTTARLRAGQGREEGTAN